MKLIESNPGLVELLPYMLSYFMTLHSENENNMKCSILIVCYLNAILKSKYFFVEPYLHQIIILLVSLVFGSGDNNRNLGHLIQIKYFSLILIKKIIKEYEVKYPTLIFQILDIYKENLSITNINSLMTCFGSIEGIKFLGPLYRQKLLEKEIEIKGIVELYKKYKNNKEISEGVKLMNLDVDYDNVEEDRIKYKFNEICNIDDINLTYDDNKRIVCLFKSYKSLFNK